MSFVMFAFDDAHWLRRLTVVILSPHSPIRNRQGSNRSGMQRILIPVDFTGSSRAAIDYALDLYDPARYSFVLLHAYSSTRTSEFLVSIEDIIEKDIERKMNLERDHMNRLCNKCEVSVELKWEKCEIIEAIDRVTESLPVELIIIGSDNGVSWTGNSNLTDVKTMDFIKQISLPVLIVPQNGSLRHPRDFLFATRLNNVMNEGDVAPLISVIRNCKGHLDVINVENHKMEAEEANERLRTSVNGLFNDLPVAFHALEGSEVFTSIRQFTDSHHSDLVCILYREHSFLERLLKDSVSEQLVSDLNWPLLTLKHRD